MWIYQGLVGWERVRIDGATSSLQSGLRFSCQVRAYAIAPCNSRSSHQIVMPGESGLLKKEANCITAFLWWVVIGTLGLQSSNSGWDLLSCHAVVCRLTYPSHDSEGRTLCSYFAVRQILIPPTHLTLPFSPRKASLAKNSNHWFGVKLDTERAFNVERNGEKASRPDEIQFFELLGMSSYYTWYCSCQRGKVYHKSTQSWLVSITYPSNTMSRSCLKFG